MTDATASSSIEALDQFIRRKPLASEIGMKLRGKPYSELTLIEWEKQGKGPPVTRVGRTVLYHKPAVEKWLLQQTIAA